MADPLTWYVRPMLLNRVEKLMMNNPIRAAIQRRFEARRLEEQGFRLVAKRELLGQFGWFAADKPS